MQLPLGSFVPIVFLYSPGLNGNASVMLANWFTSCTLFLSSPQLHIVWLSACCPNCWHFFSSLQVCSKPPRGLGADLHPHYYNFVLPFQAVFIVLLGSFMVSFKEKTWLSFGVFQGSTLENLRKIS